ncbi:MAG: type II CRISPR-associated endonuclease Cas1 [Saprospiraceae bacterium]|nr:type II CRISPR-associated endonuclease Cas1 [Saprospiraceae bacterium]
MIKKTLYFGNPSYLHTQLNQLVLRKADETANIKIPVEDIGVLILDHPQITISHGLIAKLLSNNTAVITCDDKHLPCGMLLNLNGNILQSKRFAAQINASEPLKKQLWKQTVSAKITNQATLLQQFGIKSDKLFHLVHEIKSGDADNREAQAAIYYWATIFSAQNQVTENLENQGELIIDSFFRDRYGDAPNNLLNYGYAILRATIARSLVGSGLLPTLGIHHRNQYNAYCLADDIMEPYRPFVDKLVLEILGTNTDVTELTTFIKKQLLNIPAMDVKLGKEKRPLMVAAQFTTASLVKCFEGTSRQLLYPTIPI